MKRPVQWRLPTFLVAGLGFFGLLQYQLADWRPDPPDRRPSREYSVVSDRDSGPGTLRETLFQADAAGEPARITLRVPRIILETPLPPLVNPSGIEIAGGAPGCVIDGSQVLAAPLLELSGGRNRLHNFEMTGARVAAALLRSPGNQLVGMRFSNNEVGVAVLPEAKRGLVAESHFEGNRVGVRIDGGGTSLAIRENEFKAHELAAIWAVRPSSAARDSSHAIEVSRNRFSGDHVSLIAYDLPLRISHNQFAASREASLYLAGTGARTEGNRIREGRRYGILLEQPDGTQIRDNEIDGNAHVGVLIKGGRGAQIRENRIYRNGYGVVVVFGETLAPHVLSQNSVLDQLFDGVFVVGASPVLRDNRLLANRLAGLRVLDYRDESGLRASSPLIAGNVSRDNGIDETVRGRYPNPQEAGP